MTDMGELFALLDAVGAAVCHRLPERSFFWDGRQMPLCARCTGLYTGVFFSFCFFLWKKRKDGDTPFLTWTTVLSALALLPIAVDGFCSYIGLWESTQLLRVLTGASAGAAMPGLLLLAGNFEPARRPSRPIYAAAWELPALLAASLLWGLLLWLGFLPAALGALFSAAGVIFLWAGVFYMLLRSLSAKKALPFWPLAVCLAAGFLALLSRLSSIAF